MSSERVRQRLADIIDNIAAIEDHIGASSFAEFERDRKTIDATERCLERVIEAVVKIGDTEMERISPGFPTAAVRGLGNRLRHGYDAIDLRTLWETVTDNLPQLDAACRAALASSGGSD